MIKAIDSSKVSLPRKSITIAFLFKSMVPAILEGLYLAEAHPYNTPYLMISSKIFEGSQVKVLHHRSRNFLSCSITAQHLI